MHEYENETFDGLSLQSDCIVDYTFTDCVFENCTIEKTDFDHCVFTECIFRNCRLIGNRSFGSEMRSAVFENCTLVQVNFVTWQPGSLVTDVFDKFVNCDIHLCWFESFSLIRFDFSGNRLSECMFTDCNLQRSSFKGCPMQGTEFLRCDLQKADFRDATNYKISIFHNKLKGAHFSSPEALSLLSDLSVILD